MSMKNISSDNSVVQQNIAGDNIAKRFDEKIHSYDRNHVLYIVSSY